jgi:TRAP-type transport system small permease protein
MAQDADPTDRELKTLTHEAALDDNLFSIRLDWRRWWTTIPEIIAFICVGVLSLLVAATVLSRYTDWYRIFWAQDVIRVLFLWVVFLGGAIAVKYEAHVRMTLLSDRIVRWHTVGPVWDRVVRLSPLLAGALLLILGVTLVKISMHREMPSLEFSVGYFVTIVPVSGALMIIYVVRYFYLAFRHRKGAPSADRAPVDPL